MKDMCIGRDSRALIGFLCVITPILLAQKFRVEWQREMDGRLYITDGVIGDGGEVVVIGSYIDTIVLGSDTLRSRGKEDIVIIKYDKRGNILWWSSIGGERDDWPRGVEIDKWGNIFVCGEFLSDSIFLGSVRLSNTYYDSTWHESDVFIAKYGRDGRLLWARKIGGGLSEFIYLFHVTERGDLKVVIHFRSPLVEVDGDTVVWDGMRDSTKSVVFWRVYNRFILELDGDGRKQKLWKVTNISRDEFCSKECRYVVEKGDIVAIMAIIERVYDLEGRLRDTVVAYFYHGKCIEILNLSEGAFYDCNSERCNGYMIRDGNRIFTFTSYMLPFLPRVGFIDCYTESGKLKWTDTVDRVVLWGSPLWVGKKGEITLVMIEDSSQIPVIVTFRHDRSISKEKRLKRLCNLSSPAESVIFLHKPRHFLCINRDDKERCYILKARS